MQISSLSPVVVVLFTQVTGFVAHFRSCPDTPTMCKKRIEHRTVLALPTNDGVVKKIFDQMEILNETKLFYYGGEYTGKIKEK